MFGCNSIRFPSLFLSFSCLLPHLSFILPTDVKFCRLTMTRYYTAMNTFWHVWDANCSAVPPNMFTFHVFWRVFSNIMIWVVYRLHVFQLLPLRPLAHTTTHILFPLVFPSFFSLFLPPLLPSFLSLLANFWQLDPWMGSVTPYPTPPLATALS